jgi:hypothetical protein
MPSSQPRSRFNWQVPQPSAVSAPAHRHPSAKFCGRSERLVCRSYRSGREPTIDRAPSFRSKYAFCFISKASPQVCLTTTTLRGANAGDRLHKAGGVARGSPCSSLDATTPWLGAARRPKQKKPWLRENKCPLHWLDSVDHGLLGDRSGFGGTHKNGLQPGGRVIAYLIRCGLWWL